MIKNVNKGHTLIVKGPARLTLLEGKIDVFGKILTPEKEKSSSDVSNLNNVLIVPSAQSYPIYAVEKSKLDVYIRSEENLMNIEENSISSNWSEIKDSIIKILKQKQDAQLKIMVLGISSGKTTFIKYLANHFLKEGLKGGYLDSDLGQQIIYIPTTINIGSIGDYIVSSENINSEKTIFIGATFPKGDYKFIVSLSCKNLIDNYIKKNKPIDFVLIDTDGWIKTEAGILYKNFFINTIDPDVLIIFQDETVEELQTIEKTSSSTRKDRKIFLIKEKNKYFYDKNKDERRFLRQSQFSKKFEEFRKISIPIDDIKFIKTEYDKEKNQIFEKELDINELINLPYHYVIIGLMTEKSELIEIGLLFTINIEKNYILLYSNLTYKEQLKVKKIFIGSLRLSIKGNHQGYLYL
ncbi:MAG: Clp1/GlmU family protein [Candidatus Lokiarchaeia archaeon]|nr:Clp1/GlmU family protein [Candidatus Lokiarchaeia archaeon]